MVLAPLRRVYSSFAAHVIDVPPRLLALLFFLLVLFFPITTQAKSVLLILTTTFVYGIFAASLDLLVGRTGQISLGHALFFGLGGYVTSLLSINLKLPLWVTIPLSMLVGVLVALLIGFPCLRVKGPYLGLVSIAFPIILVSIIYYFRDISPPLDLRNIYGIPNFFPSLTYYQQGVAEYYLTLLLLLFSGIALYKIANSKTGMIFVSILDDELASKASGINVTKYKLMSFAISGLFASLAGSVNAHLVGSVGVGHLSLSLSFMPLIMMIIGGIGTIYGPIVGAFILQILDMYVLTRVVDIPSSWHYIIYAIIVIVLIIKWSTGLARFVVEDVLGELEEAREIEERGRHIWKRYKRKEKK